MDKPIMLSPHDIVAIILAVCGAIITVSGAAAVIVNFIKKAKAPEDLQNSRISKLEEWAIGVDGKLAIDKKRLDNIEYGHEITQEVLLALVNFQLSPDDGKDELKTVKKKLEQYLIARKDL